MAMPPLEAPLARLQGLIGNWKAKINIPAGPWGPGGSTAGTLVVARKAGNWLLLDFEGEMAGMGYYAGVGLLAWDAEAALYRFNWFSMGRVTPQAASGTFQGDDFVLTGMIDFNGQNMHERQTYRFNADGSIRFTMEHSADGNAYNLSLDVIYTRG